MGGGGSVFFAPHPYPKSSRPPFQNNAFYWLKIINNRLLLTHNNKKGGGIGGHFPLQGNGILIHDQRYRTSPYTGIWSVRYRKEKECRCRHQSGTRGPSLLVTECSGTGLRCRRPECRCRRHQRWCRCPAMAFSLVDFNIVLRWPSGLIFRSPTLHTPT